MKIPPPEAPCLAAAIDSHLSVIESLKAQSETVERIAELLIGCLQSGKKVLWCGNGGSAADCQHLAAELVGRFRRERKGMASVALTTDTSILTAVGNDYGYDEVFRRQVEALGREGDVVVGISTSGNSRNVCLALEEAKAIGAHTVAFTGRGGGRMAEMADLTLRADSLETARIQEAHILVGHVLCDYVEAAICEQQPTAAAAGSVL